MSRKSLIILAAWSGALITAMILDRPVAQYVQDKGWGNKRLWTADTVFWTDLLKLPGDFIVTIVLSLLLLVFHRRRFEAAGLIAGAGAMLGLNSFLKWIIGRRRPLVGIDPFNIQWFIGGIPGLLGAEKNLSFPSGHTALAFANAMALTVLMPRGRWLYFGLATVVAAERVCENAHYVSDVVAGAVTGVLAVHVVIYLYNRWAGWENERALRIKAWGRRIGHRIDAWYPRHAKPFEQP